jgi:hypothetical protein
MSRRAPVGEIRVGVATLVALSCARLGYESLPEGSLDRIPNDANVAYGGSLGGSGGSTDGGTAGGGVSAGGADASPGGSGGAEGSDDAGGSGGADPNIDAGDSDGSGSFDAGASNGGTGGLTTGCEPAVPAKTWTFASDTEGWQIEADPGANGSLAWTGATGDPLPGALELDALVSSQGNVRLYLDHTSNLSGKVIYARIFLEAGSGVSAKAFVQTGPGSAWGDGDDVYLEAQQWNCVSFDLQDPAVSTPGYDGVDVRKVGVFFFGDASRRLYVDQIMY